MLKKPEYPNNKGFTLIELMVVISIIALLSSLVLAGFKNARERAIQARAAQTMHALQIALGLYYNDHGDWPSKPGDGRMFINNLPGQGWEQFYALIKPYMPGASPDGDLISNPSFLILQGFTYMKGTRTSPIQTQIYDNPTGVYIGCIKVYDGYRINKIFLTQTSFTTKDNGFDPDGIDLFEGNVILSPSTPASSCPVSHLVF